MNMAVVEQYYLPFVQTENMTLLLLLLLVY